MNISSRPAPLLLAVLGIAVAASASPAKKPVKAVKKAAPQKVAPKKPAAKPASNAPLSLGNGIFMLGEETTAPPMSVAFKPDSTPPKPLTGKGEVVPQQNQTGLRLVYFCRSYLGRKLGNGQCTELAMYGLPVSGAELHPDYQWGNVVCIYTIANGKLSISVSDLGRVPNNPSQANIQPGDILQFEGVTFERHFTNGYSKSSYPHHTSIVEQTSSDGRTLKVLEQNVNNTQYVLESTLNLADMTEGTLKIMRPIPRG